MAEQKEPKVTTTKKAAPKKKYIAEAHLVHGEEIIGIGSEVEFEHEQAKRLLEMGAISEADE